MINNNIIPLAGSRSCCRSFPFAASDATTPPPRRHRRCSRRRRLRGHTPSPSNGRKNGRSVCARGGARRGGAEGRANARLLLRGKKIEVATGEVTDHGANEVLAVIWPLRGGACACHSIV